ncbi:MAG TPA: endonuclease/exonuclease/phosphatase family protein [Candidatus Paceibacterota bacterium]|nr:endonuclease/exonuclease/phosphatase family protein [Candidatus Paceibacterota bacterium]
MKTRTAVTWNIFGGQQLDGVVALLKELNADYIALQEVLQETDGTGNQAQTIAELLGMHMVYAPAHVLTPGGSYVLDYFGISRPMDWGNAILSVHPILAHRVHHLSEDHHRIALEATISVDGANCSVFSTHLVGGHSESLDALRLAQARELVSQVPANRALVMGDFNANAQSDVFMALSTVLTSSEPDPRRVPTRKGEQIDYIFTTPDFRVQSTEMPRSSASDHFPLVAKFSVEPVVFISHKVR